MKIKLVELEKVNSFDDLINLIAKDIMGEELENDSKDGIIECPYDLENPLKEGKGFKCLIPSEAFDKLVEARKALVESVTLIHNEMKKVKNYIDETDHYGRSQILIMEDLIKDTIVDVNSLLCFNNDFKEYFDQEVKEQGITPQQFESAILMDLTMKRL